MTTVTIYPKGTRVRKVNSIAGEDAHADGALATVISAISAGDLVAYCVYWDDTPGIPCWIAGHRVERVMHS